MELTSRTIDILRNFANINPNIVVAKGNILKTMSIKKNLVVTAVIEESFPTDFGIYDLSEFLSVLNLVDNPRIEFDEKNCSIRDGSGLSSVKYFYCDPEMLTAPKKDIQMPDAEVKFVLTNDTLSKIKRAASALGHEEINIRPSNGAIEIVVNGKSYERTPTAGLVTYKFPATVGKAVIRVTIGKKLHVKGVIVRK